MASLEELYNHLKTLTSQWFYTKSEVNSSLDDKVDKETGKGLSSNDYTTTEKNKLAGIEAQANKTTVDSSLSNSSENPVQNKVINAALSSKADSSSVPTKTSDLTNDGDDGTNVFVKNNDSRLSDARTPSSHTHGNLSNDGKVGTASGKIITTGTGGAIQASDSITKSQISDFPSTMTPSSHTHGDITNDGKIGSTANKPIITGTGGKLSAGSFGTSANTFCEGNDSRLSDARTPTAHEHAATEVKDANAANYSNIGSLSANATQQTINNAINTIIGTLTSIQAIQVVDTKPTASAETMGKLYIVSENSKVNVYYTKQTGTGSSATYSWQKMDADILDELSISWNDIQSKPSSFTPSSHTHGNITNAGAIGSAADKVVVTTTNGVLTTSDMITEMNTVIEALIDYGE